MGPSLILIKRLWISHNRSFYITNYIYTKRMVEPILDWDRVIHKGVRSSDYEDMGNVIGIDKDSLTLMMGRHEYKIYKTAVQGFNGSELFLNIPATEVFKLEVKT